MPEALVRRRLVAELARGRQVQQPAGPDNGESPILGAEASLQEEAASDGRHAPDVDLRRAVLLRGVGRAGLMANPVGIEVAPHREDVLGCVVAADTAHLEAGRTLEAGLQLAPNGGHVRALDDRNHEAQVRMVVHEDGEVPPVAVAGFDVRTRDVGVEALHDLGRAWRRRERKRVPALLPGHADLAEAELVVGDGREGLDAVDPADPAHRLGGRMTKPRVPGADEARKRCGQLARGVGVGDRSRSLDDVKVGLTGDDGVDEESVRRAARLADRDDGAILGPRTQDQEATLGAKVDARLEGSGQ